MKKKGNIYESKNQRQIQCNQRKIKALIIIVVTLIFNLRYSIRERWMRVGLWLSLQRLLQNSSTFILRRY